jgi:hypothetical protein
VAGRLDAEELPAIVEALEPSDGVVARLPFDL